MFLSLYGKVESSNRKLCFMKHKKKKNNSQILVLYFAKTVYDLNFIISNNM